MPFRPRYTGLINKYRDRLPVSDDTRIISLGEGNTPLIRLSNIPKSLTKDVDIYVNGFRTQTLRLNPGRYDLENLPLNDGENEVRLEINYASGETEIITYSQFYNAKLLLAGLSDFGISAGLVSSTESDSIKYTDDVIVSAFGLL